MIYLAISQQRGVFSHQKVRAIKENKCMEKAQDGPVKKWFKAQMGIFTDVSAEIKQIWDFGLSLHKPSAVHMSATAWTK